LSRRAALELNAPVLRRYERRALRGARCVFAISPFSRDRLAEAGDLDPEAIEILPIPVDLRHFTPLDDDDWSARLAQPTLVFVGRADDPRKNAGLLLEAFPAVRERVPHVRLRFVGRPPASPLPDGAVAVGEVQDVAAHLRDAALLVLPSHQEGFGIVAAEALACGVPMVTTPCGGPEALVRISGGGAVLSSFDVEELVETISSLLLNPTCLSAMRRSGRRHVVREHAPERLRDLLESVLDPVHSR
jgi:glycosyltransferase involved in cell wall biosynthesis